MISKCKWCGKLFIRQNNAVKYCSSRCKYEAKLESKRKYINKRNKSSYAYNTRMKNLTTLGCLGTGSSSHRRECFDDEIVSIRKEKRRLGLI